MPAISKPSPTCTRRCQIADEKVEWNSIAALHPATCIAYARCTQLERRTWPYLVCVFVDGMPAVSGAWLSSPLRVRVIRSPSMGKSTGTRSLAAQFIGPWSRALTPVCAGWGGTVADCGPGLPSPTMNTADRPECWRLCVPQASPPLSDHRGGEENISIH